MSSRCSDSSAVICAGQRAQLAGFLEGQLAARGGYGTRPARALASAGCGASGAWCATAGGRSRRGRPLCEPIAIPSGVFLPVPLAFRDQRLRDHVVDEAAIVTHQQQRALERTGARPPADPVIRYPGRWWAHPAPAGSPGAQTAARAAGGCARRPRARAPVSRSAWPKTENRRDSC